MSQTWDIDTIVPASTPPSADIQKIIDGFNALRSCFSGATEPASADQVAYMFWADTTTGLLKQRNSANSAWITIGTMATIYLGLLSLAGGNLTGGLNAAKTTVASATTPDIFATTIGNTVDYTGTTTCTGFVAAPQAGCQRTLICAGAAAFTAGTNMLIDGVASASNFTASAGDKILVIAVTTTQFRLTPLKYDGTSVVASDATLTTTDVTTNNVTSSKHGFCPKAPADATKYLNGANPPAYTVPVGTLTAGTSCIQNPYTTSTKTTQAHGQAVKPIYVDFYIECLAAEQNFGVGERLGANNFNTTSSAGSPLYSYDINQVNILSPTGGLVALNGASPAGGVALTAANWKVVATPYFLN